MTRRRLQHGLTLVELLIAMGVFAFVSAAAVSVLSLASNSRTRMADATAQIAELERARSIMRTDFIQLVNRPYREPYTTGLIPPFLGGIDAESVLESQEGEIILAAFVRNGWVNPGSSLPRPSIQRVMYILREGQLIRRSRPYIDSVAETPTADQILFSGVDELSLRFLGGRDWTDRFQSRPQVLAPLAIRLEMTHPVYGRLTQDFLVGGTE